MNPIDLLCRLRELRRRVSERRKLLLRIAYSWCHDRDLAEDLVQETFMKALKNLGQLREVEAMHSWLCQILFNSWRDHARSADRIHNIDDVQGAEALIYEERYDKTQITQLVRRALAHLPIEQREVLGLIDIAGFSYIEAAQLLNVPVGTVNSRIARAREALRERLLRSQALDTDRIVAFRRSK